MNKTKLILNGIKSDLHYLILTLPFDQLSHHVAHYFRKPLCSEMIFSDKMPYAYVYVTYFDISLRQSFLEMKCHNSHKQLQFFFLG